MTYFLINPRLPEEYARELSRFGKCLPVPEFELMDFPVNAHPDMQALNLMGTLFIHKENHALASLLNSRGIEFRAVECGVGAVYPKDVSLNLFSVGGCLFANAAHAAGEALGLAAEKGLRLCNVKQGYTKCSSMILGDGIVTADASIHKAALAAGVNTLLIASGGIGIEKYDTGFIGGASAEVAPDKVLVFGDVGSHRDGERILAFARERGVDILSLGGALFDYGGIVRADT